MLHEGAFVAAGAVVARLAANFGAAANSYTFAWHSVGTGHPFGALLLLSALGGGIGQSRMQLVPFFPQLVHIGLDSAQYGEIPLIFIYALDHAAIELEPVQRQHFQVAEVAEAGAEIVERDAHAHGGQLGQRGGRPNKSVGGILRQRGIAVCNGSAALDAAAAALDLGEGDEVITHMPGWPTLVEQIKLADATPVIVRTQPEDGFRVRAEPILAAVAVLFASNALAQVGAHRAHQFAQDLFFGGKIQVKRAQRSPRSPGDGRDRSAVEAALAR